VGEEVPFTVGYIGTLGYSYDIPLVTEAVASLQEKGRNIRFLVMGDGPLRQQFEEHAAQKGIDAEFTGRLPYEEMVKRLVQCQAVANPIVKNSAGSIINKVGDYAAAGLPVVNTQECPEYRELVEGYNCGINCPVGQWEPVAEALERLMDDEQLRLQMGKNARRLAEDRFDRDKSYEKIADFVKTVYDERWK
jgi:glycosyltransferase involved in cell wall biosynthesis